MPNQEVKEYLSRVGIRKIPELDTALRETFGEEEGSRHIKTLSVLYDRAEAQLYFGNGSSPYLRRQEELVDYFNTNTELSVLASSFYDRVFFRKAMDYLVGMDRYFIGDILDIGCGNGILSGFLAFRHPALSVTGTDCSGSALSVAREISERMKPENISFRLPDALRGNCCDTLVSCRTFHENVRWKPLCETKNGESPSLKELTALHTDFAMQLSGLVRPDGYLVSIERYEDDSAYAGMIQALEGAGFLRVRGTHQQFSCKNGDEMATFQANVFARRKGGDIEKNNWTLS
ncbi:MAG: methyltransferase [Lachnospiraceae bacterium]|nr:methyltransferase [Lachnospiraceae bacterium]